MSEKVPRGHPHFDPPPPSVSSFAQEETAVSNTRRCPLVTDGVQALKQISSNGRVVEAGYLRGCCRWLGRYDPVGPAPLKN